MPRTTTVMHFAEQNQTRLLGLDSIFATTHCVNEFNGRLEMCFAEIENQFHMTL